MTGYRLILFLVCVAALAVGCRQMPYTQGQAQDSKIEQSKIDSKQSDLMADLAQAQKWSLEAVVPIIPEDQKAFFASLESKTGQIAANAEAQAIAARERAQKEDRIGQELNSQPGMGTWLSAGLKAATGDFSGLLELLSGLMGAGGLAAALRYKSRAGRMAEKAVAVAEMDPTEAKRVIDADPDIQKHRKKRT